MNGRATERDWQGLTERQREAVELRRRGLAFGQIGNRLGISKTSAYHLVSRALRNLGAPALPVSR